MAKGKGNRMESTANAASTSAAPATLAKPVKPTGLRATLKRRLGDWAVGWHPKLAFSPAQRERLEERLYRLATQVAGEPIEEENLIDTEGIVAWAIQAAADGLDRHLRGLAAGLGRARRAPVRWLAEGEEGPVTLGRWAARLDLATASAEELAALPAIGPGLAERIVALRETRPLRAVEDLLDVPGLGEAKLAAIRPLVWVESALAERSLAEPALDAFRRHPAMADYIEVLRETGGRFGAPAAGPTPGIETLVLDEVACAANAATIVPPREGGGRPISAEEAARVGGLIRRGQALAASAVARSEAAWAGLVNGSAYLSLALRLIESAQSEVRVTMFFMTYDPTRDHPSNALVESLVAARRRGVRVSVTLDLDRPGDVFGSRLVNKAAYDYLAAGGVEVTWDRPERLTHTKLLVVDGRDVLTGSHNWTAGSLYAYDDKSLVVRSPALAEALRGTL